MTDIRYYLTLSCSDARGIVAAVSSFVNEMDGFIIESGQYGDPSTGQFFSRIEFAAGDQTPDHQTLRHNFNTKVAAPFSMHWQMVEKSHVPNVLIMVSKQSHCLSDLLHRLETNALHMRVPAIISNHPDLEHMAARFDIPYYHFDMDEGKGAQEKRVFDLIQELDIDLVVLARYMQILSDDLSKKLAGKAINIHHSFLPSFKGAKPYQQAFDRGVKLIGATAHYVTADLDEGPIIEQEVSRVDHSLGPNRLTSIGRDIENITLARAVKYHLERRVLLNGRKTVVFR